MLQMSWQPAATELRIAICHSTSFACVELTREIGTFVDLCPRPRRACHPLVPCVPRQRRTWSNALTRRAYSWLHRCFRRQQSRSTRCGPQNGAHMDGGVFVFVGLAHRPLACLPRRKRTSPFAGSQRVCVIPCTHCATVQCVPLSLNHGAVFNHILPKHNLTPSVQQCPQPWYTRGLSTYLETLDTYNIPKRTYFVHDDLTWFIVFVLFLAVSVRSSFSINRKSFVNFHSN